MSGGAAAGSVLQGAGLHGRRTIHGHDDTGWADSQGLQVSCWQVLFLPSPTVTSFWGGQHEVFHFQEI